MCQNLIEKNKMQEQSESMYFIYIDESYDEIVRDPQKEATSKN